MVICFPEMSALQCVGKSLAVYGITVAIILVVFAVALFLLSRK